MNIDQLTIGEAKQLAAMFSAKQEASELQNFVNNQFVGKYVIARCYSAGVHAGMVVRVDGENVILKDSRRLWSWRAADGVALSGVAQSGLKDGKLDVVNPLIYLTGVCELIPCSDAARENIDARK